MSSYQLLLIRKLNLKRKKNAIQKSLGSESITEIISTGFKLEVLLSESANSVRRLGGGNMIHVKLPHRIEREEP